MSKNILIVTGGAGFIGSNLIERLTKLKKKFKIISIDNYSSGSVKNHIRNKNVKYINSSTEKISKILKTKKKLINSVFHFGEFSRIHQSFKFVDQCFKSNVTGTNEVFKFCLTNKIKLIYSATSASLGNNGKDKDLSPYAFTKSKNLELLENFKRWFDFKFEVIYFYNVYGERQISNGEMATVIGIFENQLKKKKPITIVKPGTQSRRFTHIQDSIDVCVAAWKKNKNKHYIISSKKEYTILEIAKMFSDRIKYISNRKGERYNSSIINYNLDNKLIKVFGKKKISEYIYDLKKNYNVN